MSDMGNAQKPERSAAPTATAETTTRSVPSSRSADRAARCTTDPQRAAQAAYANRMDGKRALQEKAHELKAIYKAFPHEADAFTQGGAAGGEGP